MTVSHLKNEIKRIVTEYQLEDQVTVIVKSKKSKMTKLKVLEREHISELVEQAGSVYKLSKETGLQYIQISNYLKGKTKPSLSSLLKLNEYKSQKVDDVRKI